MRIRWIGVAGFLVACGSTARPEPAGTVSSGSDAGSPAATPDAGSRGGARLPGTWCADHPHDLCDDFDDPANTARTWSISDSLGTSGTGIPPRGALETASTKSAPNAFASKTAALSTSSVEAVQIQASSSPPDGQGHVEADFAFEVRVQVGTAARMEIARVQGVNPINFRSYGFALLVSKSGASIELQAGASALETRPLSRAPAQGVWTHIAIHVGMNVVVNGPPTTITIQIGDGDGAPEAFALEAGMGVRPFLFLGARVTGPADACEIDYDNVTYDAR